METKYSKEQFDGLTSKFLDEMLADGGF